MTGTAAALVYSLCLLTSLACAGLLARAWLASRARLLLYSALCFGFLALNNLLVVADMLFTPEHDLTLWRQLALIGGLSILLYGFIWEAQ